MTRAATFLALALSLAAVPLALGGELNSGESAFATCAACHGPQGEGDPKTGAPAIGGQEQWYLVRQLQNFRAGVRGADAAKDPFGLQMAAISKTLDDATIASVADYVSKLPPSNLEPTVAGDAAAGATHFAVCGACHGADAKGNKEMNAPALVFQQDWYVQRQIHNFKTGVRGSHPGDTFGAQMKPMADMLDDKGVSDVVAYLASLRK